jgi:uncharacterized Zn-finger protein
MTKTMQIYNITKDDLPLHCPTKKISLWNSHPRVYLPVKNNGEALCPYCGTKYRLMDTASSTGNHEIRE